MDWIRIAPLSLILRPAMSPYICLIRTHLFIASFIQPSLHHLLPLFFVRALWFAVHMLAPREWPGKGCTRNRRRQTMLNASISLFLSTSTPTLPHSPIRIRPIHRILISYFLPLCACDIPPTPHSTLLAIITPDGRKTSAYCDLDDIYPFYVALEHTNCIHPLLFVPFFLSFSLSFTFEGCRERAVSSTMYNQPTLDAFLPPNVRERIS
ncbi:hypothetical protein EDB83DRAFT_730559 [Lactarius deliciosus]|nr:hypothetical protein EDB83DRAFT_730559 [Lactarius deliciosus]